MGETFDFVAAVQERVARFSALARRTPHDARLPHLRRWTVHDVVAHLASDHRRAEQIPRTHRAPARVRARPASADGIDELGGPLTA